ncbi:hypothetical protein FM104_11495 [Microbacterium esteraromaticum]|uniref:Uncharacterized protein n=1 Tax=Microbacterium esteraromaticum TaxID=57043 RepID=A0A1R4KBB8_9MICO|nr:hypothetical protein [Microbacterium esteraromaticum]SJN41587.1 hypothetical protein FM104_11495 [Microbacterium esteraromaticum]
MSRSTTGLDIPDEPDHAAGGAHTIRLSSSDADDSSAVAYSTEIDKLDLLSEEMALHSQHLVLQAAAQLLMRARSELASFSLVGDREVWRVVEAFDDRGQSIALEDSTTASVNSFLAERGLIDADSHPDRTMLQIEVRNTTDAAGPKHRFIDVHALNESDFDAVIESARRRLGLIEPGRTRHDFDVEIRKGMTFQNGLDGDQVRQATDIALRYYHGIVREGGGAIDVEAESFHEAIGIAARELMLEDTTDDDHRERPSVHSRRLG